MVDLPQENMSKRAGAFVLGGSDRFQLRMVRHEGIDPGASRQPSAPPGGFAATFGKRISDQQVAAGLQRLNQTLTHLA
jgi:hypothetical protein